MSDGPDLTDLTDLTAFANAERGGFNETLGLRFLRVTVDEVVGHSLSEGQSMRAWGSRYARLVYERCGRNKRRACRLLDISYHTLQAYLRYAEVTSTGSEKQLPAWVKSASQDDLLEEAGA